MQHLPAQAEFFQYAGAKVFDEDIGVCQQRLEDAQAIRVLEVQGQGFLVACLDKPPQRRALI